MAKRRKKQPLAEKRMESLVFLPDCLEQVKAIAMQGLSDDEMAQLFAIPERLFDKWKKFYPAFKEAIEEGRTHADANVVKALYQVATGYSHSDVKIHYDPKDQRFYEHEYIKHFKPDMAAIKFWLNSRQREQWRDVQEHDVKTEVGLGLPGMKNETKDELISSILGLIKPKPDGE